MKFFILRIWDVLRAWTLKWAHSPHMAAALFFIALIEASFFPIPPDILMVAILLINAERWWFYAGLTAIGSVFGAMLGYAIGLVFYEFAGRYIINVYGLQDAVNAIALKYSKHVFLTVFTGAFTPIPFKVITIAAGLFKVSFWQMVFAAVVGRSMRYFIVAFAVRVFGKKINHLVVKYFNIISILFVALLVGGFLVLKYFLR